MTQSGHSAATGTYIKFNITKRPEVDMRPRGTANDQPGKGKRRSISRPKARKIPAEPLPIVDLQEQLGRRTHERDEALEQLSATSEVLKVISSSPSELKPVFDAILEHATRICEAKFGTMWLREGDAFRVVALHNAPPAYAELRRRNPIVHPHPKSGLGRLVATRQVVHIADILE